MTGRLYPAKMGIMEENVKISDVLDLIETFQDVIKGRKCRYFKSSTAYFELDHVSDMLSDLVHDIRRLK